MAKRKETLVSIRIDQQNNKALLTVKDLRDNKNFSNSEIDLKELQGNNSYWIKNLKKASNRYGSLFIVRGTDKKLHLFAYDRKSHDIELLDRAMLKGRFSYVDKFSREGQIKVEQIFDQKIQPVLLDEMWKQAVDDQIAEFKKNKPNINGKERLITELIEINQEEGNATFTVYDTTDLKNVADDSKIVDLSDLKEVDYSIVVQRLTTGESFMINRTEEGLCIVENQRELQKSIYSEIVVRDNKVTVDDIFNKVTNIDQASPDRQETIERSFPSPRVNVGRSVRLSVEIDQKKDIVTTAIFDEGYKKTITQEFALQDLQEGYVSYIHNDIFGFVCMRDKGKISVYVQDRHVENKGELKDKHDFEPTTIHYIGRLSDEHIKFAPQFFPSEEKRAVLQKLAESAVKMAKEKGIAPSDSPTKLDSPIKRSPLKSQHTEEGAAKPESNDAKIQNFINTLIGDKSTTDKSTFLGRVKAKKAEDTEAVREEFSKALSESLTKLANENSDFAKFLEDKVAHDKFISNVMRDIAKHQAFNKHANFYYRGLDAPIQSLVEFICAIFSQEAWKDWWEGRTQMEITDVKGLGEDMTSRKELFDKAFENIAKQFKQAEVSSVRA